MTKRNSSVAGRPLAQDRDGEVVFGELRDVAASEVQEDAPQAVGVRPDNSTERTGLSSEAPAATPATGGHHMSIRTYVLELPDLPYVSPNKRGHWTERSRCNAAWRQATRLAARTQQVPALDRIKVELDFFPGDNRRRDEDNLVSGVLKPCVDGLVDAGVVADDTWDQVVREMPRIHRGKGTRRWLLTVSHADAA